MYIVHQAECIVIERLGKFHRVLTSGLHFTVRERRNLAGLPLTHAAPPPQVPLLDRPRSFTWRRTFIDTDSTMRDEKCGGAAVGAGGARRPLPLTPAPPLSTNNYRIDLRESLLNLLPTQCFSRDTILIDVNSLMFFRIEDVRKAIYEVDDLQSAVVNVAQTQLKEVFGHMTFSEAMASQSKINRCAPGSRATPSARRPHRSSRGSYMKEAFGPRFKKWGIRVERMELLDMKPKASAFCQPLPALFPPSALRLWPTSRRD